jgi:hypothetical protein
VDRMSAAGESTPVSRLVNLTPHSVTIRVGESEVELPAADVPARLAGSVEDSGSVRFDGLDIPVVVHRYTRVVGLPTEAKGVFCIVSQLVVDFVVGRDDLLTPDDLIRDISGNVIGCRALARRRE